jgi:DNA-3-methyladenine glycosylase II
MKMGHEWKSILKPVSPYDFDLSATIFSSGDKQIRRYENGQFWQVIRLGNKLVLATVRSIGTVDAPELTFTLASTRMLNKDEQSEAGAFMYRLLNLGLDLRSFYKGVKHDAVLRRLTGNLKGLRFMTTGSLFEALVYAICEQQISLAVARYIETKIIKAFGDTVRIGGDTYYAFPTPQALSEAADSHEQRRGNLPSEHGEREGVAPAALPTEGATRAPVIAQQLRACGLSQKKAEYVRDISRMVARKELDLDKFGGYKHSDEIIDELRKIRGIGLWTAEYVLIRGMSRLEALPADDLGIRRSISRYYFHDEKITAEQARRLAENWGPWRGLASFYLLSAQRLGIKA